MSRAGTEKRSSTVVEMTPSGLALFVAGKDDRARSYLRWRVAWRSRMQSGSKVDEIEAVQQHDEQRIELRYVDPTEDRSPEREDEVAIA